MLYMHIMFTVSVLMGCVLAIMRWSVVYRGGGETVFHHLCVCCTSPWYHLLFDNCCMVTCKVLIKWRHLKLSRNQGEKTLIFW